MFKRKISNEIIKWHDSLKIKKRALIIKGLRQIGKTTVVKQIASELYDNVIYINFMNDESIKKVFDNDLNVNRIIRDLSAQINSKFIPYKTIIIFDELQECSNARSSIKPFMEDGRFDIIGTGSLLGLRGYNKKKSKGIPTGFERIIVMKPMDFEEYLWAIGVNTESINYIKECFLKLEKVSESVNKTFMEYFKEYLCVGGMPDVVNTFLLTHDINQVYDVQESILEEYQDDFGKHLDENEEMVINHKQLAKIMEVFKSLPSQLAKENKKFQYSLIDKKAKGRDYRDSITWLEEFGLITLCYNLNSFELPLEGNYDKDAFKVYIADTGLFVAMLEIGTYSKILNGDLGVYKGAIFENLVADSFSKNGKSLYYFRKDSGLEIDFVTTSSSEATLIKVKSSNGNTKSLSTILNNRPKYHVSKNYKLINGNVGNDGLIQTIPLYMSFLIC